MFSSRLLYSIHYLKFFLIIFWHSHKNAHHFYSITKCIPVFTERKNNIFFLYSITRRKLTTFERTFFTGIFTESLSIFYMRDERWELYFFSPSKNFYHTFQVSVWRCCLVWELHEHQKWILNTIFFLSLATKSQRQTIAAQQWKFKKFCAKKNVKRDFLAAETTSTSSSRRFSLINISNKSVKKSQ